MMDKESPEGLVRADDDALNAWLASAPSAGTCRVVVAALLCGVMFLAGCEDTKPAVPAQVPAPIVVEQIVEPKLTPIKILAGFDSITVGDGQRSWRDDVDAALRLRGFEPTWVVAAVGGSRCTTWAGMIDSLIIANRPDVLLIQCGTNDDMSSKASRAEFAAKHLSMISTARNAGVKVAVSTIQVSRVDGRPDLAWLPGFERQTNPLIRANAAFYGDVAFADIEAIPATQANNPDGVHPGPAGMALYAAAWISAGARQGWWAP